MAVITMRQMLEAGVHFGHQTRRWNPKMKRFIFGERNGIYIIDLEQTLGRVERAYAYVRDLVAGGGVILFVGTKKQAQDPVRSYAEKCGMPFVNERWLGGMLTNFDTISKRVGKMLEYERMRDSGEFEAMPKKEALLLTREMEKLQRNLGGLRGLDRAPDAIFVLDTKKEHIAVTEANKLGIPVVAVVDTNVDPELVQYPIPGNDDAIRANSLLARVIADAVEEGRFIAAKRDPGNAAGRRARPRRRPRSPPSRPRPATPPPGPRPSARPASPPLATPPLPPSRTSSRPRSCPPSPTPSRPWPTPSRPCRRGPVADEAGRHRGASRRSTGRAGRRVEHHRHRHPRRRGRHHRRDRDRRDRGELMAFTAKDVQALRQATGAGMMDAKKALEANDGDMEAAKQWLREQGLAASAKRDDRENTQGVVALVVDGNVGAIVELKCETDFVAGSEHFKLEAQELAHLVAAKGADAVAERQDRLEDLKITLKEKIELGRVVRLEAADGDVLDSYLHIQGGRGVNGVLVVLAGGDAAARPRRRRAHRLRPPEVPQPATTCRPTSSTPSGQTLEAITRNEGKPEQALAKIVEGRLQRLLQDRRPARPALRQGRQADHRASSSATPRSSSFAQVEIG